MGSLVLGDQKTVLVFSTIHPSKGYAYFATAQRKAREAESTPEAALQMLKVGLGEGSAPPKMLQSYVVKGLQSRVSDATIDTRSGYGYLIDFGITTYNTSARVPRMDSWLPAIWKVKIPDW